MSRIDLDAPFVFESASVDDYVVTVETVENIVREFLDKYNPQMVGSKAEQFLVQQLKKIQ